MRRFWAAVFALTALAPAAGAYKTIVPGLPAEDPTVCCVRAAQPPVIDGRLDDACWKGAPQIPALRRLAGVLPVHEQSTVSLAWDTKGLYIAFHCKESQPERINTDSSKDVWAVDSVEMFIDADRDRQQYQHFVMDASGRQFHESGTGEGSSFDRTTKLDWKAATSRTDDGWAAEVFIPAGSIGMRPEQGAALRANFMRNENRLSEHSAWSLTPEGYHQPLCFANVVLGEPGSLSATLQTGGGVVPGRTPVGISVRNNGAEDETVRPVLRVYPADGKAVCAASDLQVLPQSSLQTDALLNLPQAKRYSVDLFLQRGGAKAPVFCGSWFVQMAPRPEQPSGYTLRQGDWGTLWNACATYKVQPATVPPIGKGSRVQISAARNEYEPFQLVLTPTRELKGLNVTVSALRGPQEIPASQISVRQVVTLMVKQPTTPDRAPGEYPDPLPDFQPEDVPAGRSTAVWFTVHVPEGTKPGEYAGEVKLEAGGMETQRVPVRLRVWNFTLPKISALRTAYGSDAKALGSYHGAREDAEGLRLADLLNQDFIQHHVSPYNPAPFSDPVLSVENGKLKVDWTAFDEAAAKTLPLQGSFNVPYSWRGEFLGSQPDTPEYASLRAQYIAALGQHLKEKGWLEKAYAYIFDEPEPSQYPMLVQEAKLWHTNAPGLKVLLTEEPGEALAGSVDIWSPLLSNWTLPASRLRQKAGDEVWWYVCCGPGHPYPNNFIDYPAVDHRILHWMNFKYGVTGVLYWSTMWWRDNPWTTAMSYTPDGTGTWGNGDGRMLYPAVRERSEAFVDKGPVDSIRWEMIREGIEDYDYLKMLSDAVKSAEASGKNGKAVQAGRKALARVDQLVRGVTDFEKDPEKLMAAREAVARALDRLTVEENSK